MAKYLDTQEISANISKIIKEAKKDLIIISPYLKVNDLIKENLEGKSKISNILSIKMIYGKNDLKDNEKDWILNTNAIRLFFKNNLHAKCYYNENEAIITSMNLHEFSQQNNIEMGILINKDDDKSIHEKISDDIDNILINSKEIKNSDETKEIIKEMEIENSTNNELSIEERKLYEMLKIWRSIKSKEIKQPTYTILKNEEILEIIKNQIIIKEDLKKIKGIAEIKVNKFGREILEIIKEAKNYELVKIVNTYVQYNNYEGYDRIKIQYLKDEKEAWLDTTQDLPEKNKIVAVKINKNWFNEYIYIK